MLASDTEPQYMGKHADGEFKQASDMNGHYTSWINIDASGQEP